MDEDGELGHDDERDDEGEEGVAQRLRRDRGVGGDRRRRRCRAGRPCGCGCRPRPRSAHRSGPGCRAALGGWRRGRQLLLELLALGLDRDAGRRTSAGSAGARSCRSATTTAKRVRRSASALLGPVALTSMKPRSPTWLAEIRLVASSRVRSMLRGPDGVADDGRRCPRTWRSSARGRTRRAPGSRRRSSRRPGRRPAASLAWYFFDCTVLAAKTRIAIPMEMRRIRSQFCAMTRKVRGQIHEGFMIGGQARAVSRVHRGALPPGALPHAAARRRPDRARVETGPNAPPVGLDPQRRGRPRRRPLRRRRARLGRHGHRRPPAHRGRVGPVLLHLLAARDHRLHRRPEAEPDRAARRHRRPTPTRRARSSARTSGCGW